MKPERIIFVSGWAAGEDVWKNIKGELDSDFRCQYVSWTECLGNTLENNSILKLLNAANDPVIIVGWSLGGMIALNAAVCFPEKVAGLVLISSSARMTEDLEYAGVNKRVIKAMKLRLKIDKPGLLKEFSNMGMAPAKNKIVISEFVNNALSIDNHELSTGLSYLINSDFRDLLAILKMPVHILHGNLDQIMKSENAVYLKNNLINSKLDIIRGEGHFLVQRKPQIILDSIKCMLSE